MVQRTGAPGRGQTEAQIPPQSLTSCLASGKPLNSSVSQFPHLKSEGSSAQARRLKFSSSIGLRTSALERANLLSLTNCVPLPTSVWLGIQNSPAD